MTDKTWTALVTLSDDSSLTDTLLSKASADYSVVANQAYVYDRFIESFVQVPNRYVTGRETHGRLENWEVVKDRYVIEQNSKILDRATNLANRYGDSARLWGCGALDEGRKFFALVHTGFLSVTTAGEQTDTIDSYVVVMSSHDGSIPICYYNLDSRRCTHTTYRLVEPAHCDFSIRKRHTPSEANLESEIKEVMQMRSDWSQYLIETISSFSKPISTLQINDLLETIWPLASVNTEKKREHIEAVHNSVKELYCASRNSGMYGRTKWALLNAMNEYIDFHRNIEPEEAAQHALEIDNYSHRLKLEVHKCLSV